MVSLSELDEVYNYIKGKDSFVSILYCVSEYPCPREKFNLLTITNFQEKYPNTIIGFSDHSLGFEPSLAAVNLGARIIEKHFTLSRDFWGSDHKVSLIPSEMKKMVSQIRNRSFGNISVNKFHGEKYRELEGSQNKYRPYFEKKLVAACDISKGSVIDKEMLYAMRPAKLIPGLFANETMNVIGKKVKSKSKSMNLYQRRVCVMTSRKVCFVITSPIHYARSRQILRSLKSKRGIDLQIVLAASAILPMYGDIEKEIINDGFSISAKVSMTLSGNNHLAMAKTTGLGVSEFATTFDNLKPDIVIVRGDRYEILSAAIAASYMNIILAHIEGGDISGNIDESVRHAVTKLSHIHFCSNEESARRVLQMGESPKSIFNVGCPEIEELLINEERVNSEEINNLGVGDYININKSFLIVLFHPVTTDKDNRYHTSLLLDSVRETNYQTIWFWPNADAGTGDVAKAIRVFRERKSSSNMRF